jgi:tetratricopeptide (TPR) repeat protein
VSEQESFMSTGDGALSSETFDRGADEILSSPVFGVGLPAEAERHLREAALSYHLGDVAEQHLFEARRLAPSHVAVLIGLYRFYFYKNRLEETLEIAKTCLTRAAIDNSLPLDWRAVQKGDAAFASYDAVLPRFFMFVLKGYAYLQLRLGEYAEGREAAMKLLELDPTDKVGARLLISVLDEMEAGDVD